MPLSATASTLLTRRRAEVAEDESCVFPSLSLTSDAHKALGVIHGSAYTWKDLRRTVATRLAGLGFDETTIGRVLNHARVSVTSRSITTNMRISTKPGARWTAWDVELQRILAQQAESQGRCAAHAAHTVGTAMPRTRTRRTTAKRTLRMRRPRAPRPEPLRVNLTETLHVAEPVEAETVGVLELLGPYTAGPVKPW